VVDELDEVSARTWGIALAASKTAVVVDATVVVGLRVGAMPLPRAIRAILRDLLPAFEPTWPS
jgi:hypothetical protein